MPLASDARPRGADANRGKGALRWSAPIVNTSRPDGAPRAARTSSSRDASGRVTASSGRGRAAAGRGSRRGNAATADPPPPPASDESFDEAFTQLAEEVERELSAEPRTSRDDAARLSRVSGGSDASPSGERLPDPSEFRRASRTAIGSFIKQFRAADADDDDHADPGAMHWWRDRRRRENSHRHRLDDDHLLSDSPAPRTRRRVPLDASVSASAVSDGWASAADADSPAPSVRAGGFVADGEGDDVAWARWGGGGGITIVETDRARAAAGSSRASNADSYPDATGMDPRDGDDAEEDILEAWRRRRRREAATLGAEASGAARAAAAVATLEMATSRATLGGDDHEGFDVDALIAAARAKVSVDRADADAEADAKAEAEAEAEASRAAEMATSGFGEGAGASPRRRRPASPVSAVDSAVQTDDASLTPSRARRSLEFPGGVAARREAETAPSRDDATNGDDDDDERRGDWESDEGIRRGETTATSTPASSAPATPSGSPPRCENTSPGGDRPDISDILGDTVGGLLFGDVASAAAGGFGLPPRPPPRVTVPVTVPVPSGMISPPPSPDANANASAVERRSSSEAAAAAGRAGRPPLLGRPPLMGRPPLVPPRKPDADARAGLSPIEMVAAEVRSPPTRETSDARQDRDAAASASVSGSGSGSGSGSCSAAYASTRAAAAAAAAAAADNPWLPSRMQPLARAPPHPQHPQHPPPPPLPPPRRASPPSKRSPTGARGDRLGDEWARPEDEDDALVVMLRARVANLEEQLAKFTAERRREVGRA